MSMFFFFLFFLFIYFGGFLFLRSEWVSVKFFWLKITWDGKRFPFNALLKFFFMFLFPLTIFLSRNFFYDHFIFCFWFPCVDHISWCHFIFILRPFHRFLPVLMFIWNTKRYFALIFLTSLIYLLRSEIPSSFCLCLTSTWERKKCGGGGDEGGGVRNIDNCPFDRTCNTYNAFVMR